MTKKHLNNVILCLMLFFLLACGGGSGGSSSSLTGSYSGDLFLSKNTCDFSETDINGFNILVNQVGSNIAVQNINKSTQNYAGSTPDNSNFSASRTFLANCTQGGRPVNSTAQIVETINFSKVNDGAEIVFISSYGQCSGGNSVPACETIHNGVIQLID